MIDRSEFFQQPAWFSIVKRNFASGTRNFVDLEVTPLTIGEKVKIPFVIEELNVPTLGNVRFSRYASVYLSDYLDFTNSESLDVHSIEELTNKARNMGVDVLWLTNIPLRENLFTTLQEFSKNRQDCYFLDCIPTLGIRCDDTYEKYLLNLSKNSRRNIRRKNEAIKKIGAEHRVVGLTEEKINILLRNQSVRAQNTDLDIIVNNPSLSKVFTDMIDLEDVQMSEMFVGNRVISQSLLLVSNKTIGVLAQSFDEAYSHYSPSFCNLANLIEFAHSHGYKYVDLLKGDEDYKRHFTNNVIEMRKFILVLNPRLSSEILLPFLQNTKE